MLKNAILMLIMHINIFLKFENNLLFHFSRGNNHISDKLSNQWKILYLYN